MRYWDSSAILPMFVDQVASAAMRELSAEDAAVATWWGTPVECVSGLARLEREGALDGMSLGEALANLRRDSAGWTEIGPSAELRQHAIRLVRVHGLRSGDALQLAAAVIASDFRPSTLDFVTLDRRQAEAAEREGFRVMGE
jgi:predicted nucleic acid-binding protein